MSAIPAPSLVKEEWPDADFDLPEGDHLHAMSDKEDDDDMDWDAEMDLGATAGASAKPPVRGIIARPLGAGSVRGMTTIRPPLPSTSDFDDDDDDEGVSTIKVAALPKPIPRPPSKQQERPPVIDEDFEDAFALPSDLTQLSLAPLSLNHRSSKTSLEWGDKDHTSSSQSSDAYSTLGLADASPSSNSASSVSLPDTETEDDDDSEGDLDGLVIPTDLFDSGAKKLTKLLDKKKEEMYGVQQVKVATAPEEDFESGLVIDDDVELSPSRLLYTHQQQQTSRVNYGRSNSFPINKPSSLRPPSRTRSENRAKSPANPPPSSTRQLSKIRLSPSPPLRHTARSQTFGSLGNANPPPSPFLVPKPGSLRGQKSATGLKSPSPASTSRLTRKASLSSLMDTSQASGSGSVSSSGSAKARYEEPTAASRAKIHKHSATTRVSGTKFEVPPTRPSTPSSNPAALRLTMPTQGSRTGKLRPALSSVFSPTASGPQSPMFRTSSPAPRPPSSLSKQASRPPTAPPAAPRLLRKPKRARTYGDGTELDGFDDLPTDRDKEGRFRIEPKGYGNRIPGGTYQSKTGTIRRKGRSTSSSENLHTAFLATTNLPKRTKTSDNPSKKKKTNAGSPSKSGLPRRKPTLIRNLGGIGGPKGTPGNDQALRDFDAATGTSTRPALITHLTGSSIGSPVGSFASGARIVGNMIFDPQRMCWISTLPPEDEEPDVFANMADDEGDDAWETKGGTIRASLGSTTSEASATSTSTGSPPRSISRSHMRTVSESGSEHELGSRASLVCDIDDNFVENTRRAEERHRQEMRNWKSALTRQDVFEAPDRTYLFEIRALATRQY
ncbi:hypothetical protein BD626DRAFT_487739 [Schizophyllum amplum]|uniref:Uncharacterized protein n=1 Tax=Schizophyllum amplum TaxID=97359 RepID=A0A550CNP5_9AGAR|nr:hypothetical protein BD626DRAFT_487739 [Auriculariopsis ampla]